MVSSNKYQLVKTYRWSFLIPKPLGLPNDWLPGVQLPDWSKHQKDAVLLQYPNMTIVMSTQRKLAYFVAHTVDLNLLRVKNIPRNWHADPRLPLTQQTSELDYAHNVWDKGHLGQRKVIGWGFSSQDQYKATQAADVFTNCAPQHSAFNQGRWASLENSLWKTQGVSRWVVITGPVFTNEDPWLDPIQPSVRIPLAFWKVLLFLSPKTGRLQGKAYCMKQPINNRLLKDLSSLQVYQVSLAKITELTQLSFPPDWYALINSN